MDSSPNKVGFRPKQYYDHESSILSDEGSFVVLDRSPSHEPSGQFSNTRPSITSSSMNIHSNCTLATSCNMGSTDRSSLLERDHSGFATGSFSTDVSPEEIQKKLNEVLQENVSLKETLYQNNLAMKQQLTTLGTWQEEVAKLHQNHKEKFSETKDLILKLRAENEELNNALKDVRTNKGVPNSSESALITANASLLSQVAELKRQVSAVGAKNDVHIKGAASKKEQELISLTEQLNRQLEIAERSRRQLGVDVERLQAQKTRLEREITAMKVDLEAQKQRATTAEMEKQQLMQSNASGKEVEQLKAQLKEREDMIDKMMCQQEQLLPTPRTDLVTNLNKHEKKLEEIGDDLGKQADTFTSLDSWLNVAAENVGKMENRSSVDTATIIKLQAEISEVRKLLADEQTLGIQRVKMLSEAQEQFQNLFADYQKALQDLEDHNKNQNSKDRHNSSYYEVQVRGFMEKIDGMTAQILNLEDAVLQRNQKLSELGMKIQELEADNESIPVLQIQMQVYQSDFNAEREARENLAGEKERLAEDLRLLQRRNQQLLNELKLYQQNYTEQIQQETSTSVANGWTTIGTPGRNHRRENTPPSPGPFDH